MTKFGKTTHRMHRAHGCENTIHVSASSSSMVLSASLNSSCTIHKNPQDLVKGFIYSRGSMIFLRTQRQNILNDKLTDSFAHFVSSVCEGSWESELETELVTFTFSNTSVTSVSLLRAVVLIMVEDFQGNCGLVKHGARYLCTANRLCFCI